MPLLKQRRPKQMSLSAMIFWLFAQALFRKLDQILEGQSTIAGNQQVIIDNQQVMYEREGEIMTAVQIEQEAIDEVGTKLEDLVTVVNSIDLTPLAPADQSKLIGGLTDLTAALNAKVPPVTPVPTPSPDPEPTPA